MNGTPDNIIVNSCELTPIYLIQDSGIAQATSYVLTPANQVEQKPVSNLKRFYESSGNLEKSVLLNSPEPPAAKPRILKKADAGQIGNNLKLASFLVPKSSAHNVQTKPVHTVTVQTNTVNTVNTVNAVSTHNTVSNIVFKPAVATVTAPSQNIPLTMTHAVPKIDMDRKIVKLKPSDTASRHFRGRSAPKIKPKEVTPEPPKYTSVQLLKLGETYHSLNVLSDHQVKIVNQALNIIKDPEKIPLEPAYDPVTNTRFIYKVVSPKDLKVVARNKVALKEPRRLAAATPDTRPGATVVTRSGRKVRLPRQVVEHEPPAPRRRTTTVLTCAQCSADFGSIYQLQKHYESHPSHAPSKTHWSLFQCLLAIVAGSPAEARAKLFIQQLELLMRKLRALLPCLLAGAEPAAPAAPAALGDDVGRLFGLSPGKYNLDMDALSCVKDKEGHCKHNPAPVPAAAAAPVHTGKPSQRWLHQHSADTDCARVHTAHSWPVVGDKLHDIKQKQKHRLKNIRPAKDIDVNKDLISLAANDVPVPHKMISLLKNEIEPDPKPDEKEVNEIEKPKAPVRFHSAHFDIRSSPIKPSTSTVFRTFQINPDKIEKLNVQIIRPLELDPAPDEVIKETPTTSDCTKLDSIFRDDIEMSCKDVLNNELNFNNSKDWAISASNDDQSRESFIKSNAVIEPSLIHVKDDALGSLPGSSLDYSNITQNADMPVLTDDHDTQDNRLSLTQNQSVLNFLETLGNELTYPEPEIRSAAVDFQLDLFSFNNT